MRNAPTSSELAGGIAPGPREPPSVTSIPPLKLSGIVVSPVMPAGDTTKEPGRAGVGVGVGDGDGVDVVTVDPVSVAAPVGLAELVLQADRKISDPITDTLTVRFNASFVNTMFFTPR